MIQLSFFGTVSRPSVVSLLQNHVLVTLGIGPIAVVSQAFVEIATRNDTYTLSFEKLKVILLLNNYF